MIGNVATDADRRRCQLAKIHIAKKQLKLTDDVYRGILLQVGGVDSSKDLDDAGRARVLDHLRQLGLQHEPSCKEIPAYPGRPGNMEDECRGPQLKKIEALLTAGHKPWEYADGIARKVCGIDRVAWCTPDQLHKIVGVLAHNAAHYSWEKQAAK